MTVQELKFTPVESIQYYAPTWSNFIFMVSLVTSRNLNMPEDTFGTFSLVGKTAIVTGAGSGIGREIALLFAKRGAAVQAHGILIFPPWAKTIQWLDCQILDLDNSAACQVANECNSRFKHARSTAFKCDVTKQDVVNGVFSTIAQNNKRIDILVNNAGIGFVGDVLNTKQEARLLDVISSDLFYSDR